jgi:DNA-binding IclR family transcriptional regulator
MIGGDNAVGGAPASQTLDRGLRTLELVAGSETPLSIAEVSGALNLHRSIAYRMLRTLQDHDLVRRDVEGRYVAGAGLAVLARRVAPGLQEVSLPELTELADEAGMTAFLVVRQLDDAVTISVVEPRNSPVHVAYRPGTRHPVDRGAPGLALLAGEAPAPGERPEVAQTRERGWAQSHAEVLPGMRSVASPVVSGGVLRAAVAVVFVEHEDVEALGRRVRQAARAIGTAL